MALKPSSMRNSPKFGQAKVDMPKGKKKAKKPRAIKRAGGRTGLKKGAGG